LDIRVLAAALTTTIKTNKKLSYRMESVHLRRAGGGTKAIYIVLISQLRSNREHRLTFSRVKGPLCLLCESQQRPRRMLLLIDCV